MDVRLGSSTGIPMPTFFNVPAFPGPNPTVNYIVAGQTNRYTWEGTTSLTVKMFVRGGAEVRTRDAKYRLEGDHYLVLNPQTRYQVVVRTETPSDGISIFFRPGFEQEVARENGLPVRPCEFFEHLFSGGMVTQRLASIRSGLRSFGNDPLWVEEQTRDLMLDVLRDHMTQLELAANVPALRQSTKEDLYRRLLLAQDYAHSCFCEQVTLADLAKVACLSPSYFLRAYRTVFGETPHQTLVRRRLECAQDLLRGTKMSVQEVCRQVGFVSLGSFSWLFRNRVGVPPQEYRRLKTVVKAPA